MNGRGLSRCQASLLEKLGVDDGLILNNDLEKLKNFLLKK